MTTPQPDHTDETSASPSTGGFRGLLKVLVAIGFTKPPSPEHDVGSRSPRIVARIGLMLGICVVICFATGLLSHWIQHPPSWFYFPSDPPWLYRLSQGLHVITGTAAIPLLLIKLQLVYPKLFARPVIGTPLRALERLSIAVLVSSMIFQLFTGLMNTAQFYPWKFFFTTTHYAMSYVIVAALMVHIAVKLPIIQAAFRTPLESTEAIDNDPTTPTDADADADAEEVTR
ncbi:cytochrome b/b6 domain-containing protein [Williamsia phyllosphaerae]|uniref:Cytochrome b561 bacterial/Ni-hydrogenase domain-containing protein n=1 Tax=Williamsia phyllosphaerae TaxID=885042 RepID=A0ABQ1UB54_9NOCA|nr:cytochrome b/b6 domain-containing protein [Williamsia phyllosphaerae]GGF14876.1 hypothetical protein GCM10007298_08720 [Williamsia phyllosphaerae]